VKASRNRRTGIMGVEPWDTEWAADKAAEALRYLGRNYPECAASGTLREHETAANEAAMRGDQDAYLEALRAYMRAGRDEALRIRRGAA
jgi:hypothetical protein